MVQPNQYEHAQKRAEPAENVPSGALVGLVTLLRWQGMHLRAQERTSQFMLGYTYLFETSFSEALIPGCDSECNESKAWRRKAAGNQGRG